MGQVVKIYKPAYVNTDTDAMALKPNESPFLKDYTIDVNENGELNTATGNLAGMGGNMGAGTPLIGNVSLCTPLLPDGFNKVVLSGEFTETNELYVGYYNSNGNHGIYVLDGDTMTCKKVIIDPNLNFSLDPAFAIPEHRITLRVVYDEVDGELRHTVEKHLIFTDGNNWQRWINVVAAIKTDGFNEISFPYWKTRLPHFDRKEYIDYATRPPMYCLGVKPVPFSETDKGKINLLLNKSVQFAYRYIYTDGRVTTFSPYSLPFSLTSSSCNPNSSNLSRCLELTMYAGSPMVEKIQIIQRSCNGDWFLYDTIERFENCGDNDPLLIGDEYWKRTNQWVKYSYDSATNTIKYKWCGDKECGIFSQEDARRFQTDLPVKSVALTSAGDAVLLGNNLYGYDNLDCRTTEAIKLSTITDEETAGCKVDTVKIAAYSYMGSDDSYNFRCQFAHKRGENATEVFFGSYTLRWTYKNLKWENHVDLDYDVVNRFGMTFKDKEGFIMYLAGTPYYAIGKQYKVNKDGTMEYIGVINSDSKEQMNFVASHIASGGIFVMKYEFVVPKGKYIARLARHSADANGDYSKTSTWVMGISDSKLRTQGGSVLNFFVSKKTFSKEIEIDATAGNIDLWGTGTDTFFVFTPYDHEYITGSGIRERRWRFNEGYVYEDSTDKIGVELYRYQNNHGGGAYKKDGFHTDHNGFFFAYAARGDARYAEVEFWGNFKCVNSGNILFTTKNGKQSGGFFGWGASSINVVYDIYVKDNNGGTFGACNRVLVRGKITDCDGVNGIAGVAVTITRGGTAYTGSDGTFELIVHNSFEGIRKDRIYVNAGGECLFYTCDCQAPPLVDYDDSQSPCVFCEERIYPTQINQRYKLVVGRNKALKGGGRYGIGIVGFDLAGRATWVNLIDYVDIPTFLQTNDFAPRKIKWTALGNLNLPKDVAYVSFFRTSNLNYVSYIQWVGDKIEYLNTKGEAVETTGGLIRAKITIQSLLDFNNENNFGVTAKYQVQKGDIVRFYDDGDGNLFNPLATDGFMDYPILGTNYNESVQSQINVQANGSNITFNPTQQSDGKSIIIGYDKRLEQLRKKCGFWMEIIRPKDCLDKEIYCEVCGMYPVQNGEIMGGITEGVLEAWDTYYQNRFIKIKDCSGKTFNHPFESSSITDFWGENCNSCGRISYRDPQANQRWYPDDVIKSDEFVNEGRVNGLGTFREKNRKQFKGQEWGGIVSMHAERNIIAFICQNDWFLTGYDMNYVRTLADGRLAAANLDNKLNDPYQKVGDNYGCEYEHTSSIVFYNGWGFWVDAKNRGVIQLDFQAVQKISDIDNSGYFDAKITELIKYNKELPQQVYLNNLFDIIAGIDPNRNEYYVTFRKRNISNQSNTDFINIERDIDISKSETFIFSVYDKKWVRWSAIIPEFYGKLKHSKNGMLLVAFKNAIGYGHNIKNAARHNSFFGFDVPAIVVIICSDPEPKNKIFQTISIECNSAQWFADKIITNEQNSFSYIPVKYFKKKENMLYAELLRDMNSFPSADDIANGRVMLLDGKRMFGQFVRMRLVVYDDNLGDYFEVNAFNIRSTDSERSFK